MLTFTKQQMNDAYLGQDDAQLIAQIVSHLRESHACRVDSLTDDVLNDMVEVGIARARGHGFALAENLAQFVVLMFVVAPNFDTQSDIAAVLSDSTRAQESRLDSACDEVSASAWNDAEAFYDERVWSGSVERVDSNSNDGEPFALA